MKTAMGGCEFEVCPPASVCRAAAPSVPPKQAELLVSRGTQGTSRLNHLGSLLKTQILRPNEELLNWSFRGCSPSICIFNKIPGDFDRQWELRKSSRVGAGVRGVRTLFIQSSTISPFVPGSVLRAGYSWVKKTDTAPALWTSFYQDPDPNPNVPTVPHAVRSCASLPCPPEAHPLVPAALDLIWLLE